MQYLPNINKKFIVVILLLQVIIAYAIPAWASINLCIGYDGHVDLERRGFVGTTTNPFSQLAVTSFDDDHHGDCFDIGIGDFSSDYLYIRTEEFRVLNGKNSSPTNAEGAPYSNIEIFELKPDPTFYPNNVTPPSSTFSFHRTVVLLI